MKLTDVQKILTDLRDQSDMRSRTLIENGRHISKVDRAKSEGHA